MKVLTEMCTWCGECVEACPQDAIHLYVGCALIDQDRCTECLSCQQVCPSDAIQSGEIVLSVVSDQVVHIPNPVISQPQRSQFLPMIGAALLWTGREIIPRMVTMILDIFEYRLQEKMFPAASARNDQPRSPRGGRGRQRQRQYRGYRNNHMKVIVKGDNNEWR